MVVKVTITIQTGRNADIHFQGRVIHVTLCLMMTRTRASTDATYKTEKMRNDLFNFTESSLSKVKGENERNMLQLEVPDALWLILILHLSEVK